MNENKTRLKKLDDKKLQELALQARTAGANQQEVADLIGVDSKTLRSYLAFNEDFNDKWIVAKAQGVNIAIQRLYELATDPTQKPNINLTALRQLLPALSDRFKPGYTLEVEDKYPLGSYFANQPTNDREKILEAMRRGGEPQSELGQKLYQQLEEVHTEMLKEGS